MCSLFIYDMNILFTSKFNLLHKWNVNDLLLKMDRAISQLICFISHLYTHLDIISTHLIAHTLFVKENEFTYFV